MIRFIGKKLRKDLGLKTISDILFLSGASQREESELLIRAFKQIGGQASGIDHAR